MITIKRNEQQYIEVVKKHKLVCECGSEDVLIERNSNGFSNYPMEIKCKECGKRESYSAEKYNSLIRSLTEVELVEIEKFENNSLDIMFK